MGYRYRLVKLPIGYGVILSVNSGWHSTSHIVATALTRRGAMKRLQVFIR